MELTRREAWLVSRVEAQTDKLRTSAPLPRFPVPPAERSASARPATEIGLDWGDFSFELAEERSSRERILSMRPMLRQRLRVAKSVRLMPAGASVTFDWQQEEEV